MIEKEQRYKDNALAQWFSTMVSEKAPGVPPIPELDINQQVR